MSIQDIIELASLGVSIITITAGIIASVVRGKMRDFIIETMEEAEKTGMSGKAKLSYTIAKVKDKYKIAALLMNVSEFIEKIIDASKQINAKGKEK